MIPTVAADATPPSGTGIVAYQGKVVDQHGVLGPQSNPTLLTQTQPVPPGVYMVTVSVGAVISAQDQIVCAAYPAPDAGQPFGNDGVLGTAGNAGTGAVCMGRRR